MSTIQIARPTAQVTFDAPTEYVDRSLPTASWWDKYEIQPGSYAFEWVTINHTPWNSDPDRVTPGYIANIGPYYGLVTLQARMVEEYRVNRLLSESRAQHEVMCDPPIQTIKRAVYAYELPGAPRNHGRTITAFLGGRVTLIGQDA